MKLIMNDNDKVIEESLLLAEEWQNRANELINPEEIKFQKQLTKMLSHEIDKVILTQLIDQGFRSKNSKRVADQIISLLQRYGLPTFISSLDRLMMVFFILFGKNFSLIAIPLMIDKLRKDSCRVIVSGETEPFLTYLQKRNTGVVQININHLGETVLGEEGCQTLKHIY